MNVCGVEVTESRMALFVVATLVCLLLLLLTGIAMWAEGRYQRTTRRREVQRRIEPPRVIEEEPEDD